MDNVQLIDGLISAGMSGILLFLYLKQDARLQKLEDKYLALLDKLLDGSLADGRDVRAEMMQRVSER